MWTSAKRLRVSGEQRAEWERLARGPKTPQWVARRARIIPGVAQGMANSALAKSLGLSRPTVILWRGRFEELGVEGILRDAPRPGRKRRLSQEVVEAVVHTTLHGTPPNATHWSQRTMARRFGLSPSTIQRIWRDHGLQPHRVESFKLRSDPHFARKIQDIVGLYLNPPDKGVVLCVDEKSQIQALDRTQPVLPLRPGIPARMTRDYVRHGTIPARRDSRRSMCWTGRSSENVSGVTATSSFSTSWIVWTGRSRNAGQCIGFSITMEPIRIPTCVRGSPPDHGITCTSRPWARRG
jgi:transposase